MSRGGKFKEHKSVWRLHVNSQTDDSHEISGFFSLETKNKIGMSVTYNAWRFNG